MWNLSYSRRGMHLCALCITEIEQQIVKLVEKHMHGRRSLLI